MRWLWRGIFTFILLITTTPILLIFLASDSHSLVEETATINANSATKAKQIATNVYNNLTHRNTSYLFKTRLTENDINGIIAMTMRGFKGLKGRINVTPMGIKGAFTLPTPNNPFGEYINFTGTIIPSSSGLYVDTVSIGHLPLPSQLGVFITETILNAFLGGEATGSKLIATIDSIRVSGSTLIVSYRAIPALKQAIEQTKSKMRNMRNDLALTAKPSDVKVYYQNICRLHSKIGDLGSVPLGYYLSDTFLFAAQRTQLSQQAQTENKAAILALAIFLGTAQFDSFIGAIDEPTFQRCQPKNNRITLARRDDLRLHFIFSAAIKIISDSNISFAIGEFKELLDSGKGGTGFSFTDLAADRSGIRFSEFALSETGAIKLQQMAAELTHESVFFPSLTNLPDGISQKIMKQRNGLNGEFYQKHLALINQRINELPLYQ